MEARGFVIPPGQGRVWEMAAGRSSALKLLGRETGESVMMFEETAPAGTQTTYHLHHDSDEVAYVLAGEITFKIGEEVTVGGPGTCAFMPRGLAHAWRLFIGERGTPLTLISLRSKPAWWLDYSPLLNVSTFARSFPISIRTFANSGPPLILSLIGLACLLCRLASVFIVSAPPSLISLMEKFRSSG